MLTAVRGKGILVNNFENLANIYPAFNIIDPVIKHV